MKFSKPLKVQVQGFLYSMPFICVGYLWILYPDRVFRDWRPWLYSTPFIYLVGVPSWYLHIQYDHFIRKRFSSLRETGKRVFYKVFTNPLIMTPSAFLILMLHDRFHILDYQIKPRDFKNAFLIGLIINLIFDTLWEVLYTLEKFKESLAEKELLEQMATEQEFERLKSQVNPHFLFNCFNTLSSLIQEDKKEAEHFLDELSKVYRYLLKNNEDGMTTVEKELSFIHSYFQLLKTRYGDALQMRMDIDERYFPFLLPSLSLQLLVENAVKHNIVSKQQPLMLEIFSANGDKLVVNNNLQRKPVNKSSTGIGLNNISAKYKLMKQEGFEIVENESHFMVMLPLKESGKDMVLIQ
jgi:hypothetical protein